MNWIEFARGTVRIAILGAYPQSGLNRLAAQQIPFWDIVRVDPFRLELTIYSAHLRRSTQLVERSMCELKLLDHQGFAAKFRGLRRRPVLLAGLLLGLALVFWSQQYLWTIEVQGNDTVPAVEILRTLAELGVHAGTPLDRIDPQRLENRMLDRMPALSWFTINANSARATVLVKERIPKPELVETREPTNVIASQAGLIETMEVYDGEPQVEPGQMVIKGQLLVSGLTTPWRTTVLHHAMAEVYARTWRTAEIICSRTMQQKQKTEPAGSSWRLIIGNKLMKICGDSGISTAGCDKMITTYPLMLPGGITLPIALERTDCRRVMTEETARDAAALQERLMSDYALRIRGEMIAGQIHSADGTLSEQAAYWHLWAVCECTEQIGELSPILLDTKDEERG